MIDLMDLALDAMERGDHEEGLALAAESNRRLRWRIEARMILRENDPTFMCPAGLEPPPNSDAQ